MKLTVISLALLAAAVVAAVLTGSALSDLCDRTELVSVRAIEFALNGDLDRSAELIGEASKLWSSTEIMCELLFIRDDFQTAERSLALAREYARTGEVSLCCGELRRAILAIDSLREADRLSLKKIF